MPSSEVKDLDEDSSLPNDTSLAKGCENSPQHGVDEERGNASGDDKGNQDGNECDKEDKEEDADFNPLLQESPSQEASSSLSSEAEGLDAGIADSGGVGSSSLVIDSNEAPCNSEQDYPGRETDHGEEVVAQNSPTSAVASKEGLDNGSLHDTDDGSGAKVNIDNHLVVGENNLGQSKKPVIYMNDEGAISMRTRARYSLASFTLDELETFLQETDDDDDLQKVDEEEEYRKFLAAVLQGGDSDSQNVQNENVDDEDEENDADFDLEIEEALESDIDEETRDEIQDEVHVGVGRRPKTRQNKRQKAIAEEKKKLLEQLKRPLRPLLPTAPIISTAPFPSLDGKSFIINHPPEFLPPPNDGSINGFTPHQIGQLHCLIHEHVQLLIQVFSLCVLEPSRRHISAEVQELVMEMLRIRDHVLAWRRLPYPSFCFFPPHVHPSVPSEVSKISMSPCMNGSSSVVEAWRSCASGNNIVPPDIISTSKGRRECLRNGQDPEGAPWVPYVNGPVLCVLDVAPLRLVGNYLDDIYSVVQEYYRRQLDVASDARSEREPLFPLQNYHSSGQPYDKVSRDTACPTPSLTNLPSKTDQTPKKTMASALVERAKKQSVAPVPKEIAKLARRFYPLFNPALYPHKPPPAPVANRVLFTDAEDELLALGIMEYNTDWKAIQQRFLPCKSKHQIFVRQKNRASSKAPENPIKAVRRIKNSPLTSEEMARIEEGLKRYKLDWMSIWKFIVPYRDPSLLPRQWRIANGTQKSYKSDADKKAKRRLYELRRRNSKPAASPSCHTSSEKEDNSSDKAGTGINDGDKQMVKENEAYVHEAFLAEWRPSTSCITSKYPSRGSEEKSQIQLMLAEGSQVREQLNSSGIEDSHPPTSREFRNPIRPSVPQSCSRPYRAYRSNNDRIVKLAPDLPPVNLPPSVRVMSQSAFKSYQGGASLNSPGTVAGHCAENRVPKVLNCTSNACPVYPVKRGQIRSICLNNGTSGQQQQDSVISKNRHVEEEKDDSGLQMHPLLFQAPDDGRFSYYHLNSSATRSSSLNFLSGSPSQLNLSLFHNQRPVSQAINFLEKSLKSKQSTLSSSGIDFHPLLQRTDDISYNTMGMQSATQLSANLESSGERGAQSQNSLKATSTMSCIYNISTASSSRPISPNDKINELDLDIRLSFTSRMQKAFGNRDIDDSSIAKSAAGSSDSSRIKSKKAKDSLNQCGLYMPAANTPDKISGEHDSGVHVLAAANEEENDYNVDNAGDQSLPEIVMEQEELSDSEDEIGENVEFECEEMADSEADNGSDSDQIIDIQDEEVENVALEADFDDQQDEPSVAGDPEGDAFGSSESRMRDIKTNKSSRSFLLNLNSCPPGSPPMEPKHEVPKPIQSSSLRKAISSWDRSIKISESNANDATTLEPDAGSIEPNPKSCTISSGKSRKRASTTDARSRGRPRRRTASLKSDTNATSSKHVSKDESG